MVQAGIETLIAPPEDALRAMLAAGDRAIGSIGPVMRTLLANEQQAVFSDEVVARVRGMIGDLSRQLLRALAVEAGEPDPDVAARARAGAVGESLTANAALLGHVHALALEWRLSDRLHQRNGLDPALSPLLQARIASRDAEVCETAMTTLTAQARFLQRSRRMELPLAELPGDLFHVALQVLATHAGTEQADAAERAVARLRAEYDEGHSRLALIARLVTTLGATANTALAVDHAGVAIFLSAMALASGQDRDLAALAASDLALVRLGLSLRTAGLKREQIEAQFAYLSPDAAMPDGLDALRPAAAAALLASADPFGGA